MNEKRGKLIVVVAPSGGGKSTLIKKLRQEIGALRESISCTTRPKRPGEVDGQHYFFLSENQFKKKIEEGDFLEWAMVHSNYYGTSKQFVESNISQGNSILFDLDVQGADALKKYFGDQVKVIFIAPPSMEELEKRLRNRRTDSEEVINVRLQTARKEMARQNDFDYCLINDQLERAYAELKLIIRNVLEG